MFGAEAPFVWCVAGKQQNLHQHSPLIKRSRPAILQPESAKRRGQHARGEPKTQYGILFQDVLRTAALTGVTQISEALPVIVTIHLVRLAETMGPGSPRGTVTSNVVCVQALLQLQGAYEDIVTVPLIGRGTVGVTGGETGVGMQ